MTNYDVITFISSLIRARRDFGSSISFNVFTSVDLHSNRRASEAHIRCVYPGHTCEIVDNNSVYSYIQYYQSPATWFKKYTTGTWCYHYINEGIMYMFHVGGISIIPVSSNVRTSDRNYVSNRDFENCKTLVSCLRNASDNKLTLVFHPDIFSTTSISNLQKVYNKLKNIHKHIITYYNEISSSTSIGGNLSVIISDKKVFESIHNPIVDQDDITLNKIIYNGIDIDWKANAPSVSPSARTFVERHRDDANTGEHAEEFSVFEDSISGSVELSGSDVLGDVLEELDGFTDSL